jgi:hypothetical protein
VRFTIGILAACALIASCGTAGREFSASGPAGQVPAVTGGSANGCCSADEATQATTPSQSGSSHSSSTSSSRTKSAGKSGAASSKASGAGKGKKSSGPPHTPAPGHSTSPPVPAPTKTTTPPSPPPTSGGGACSAARNTPGGHDPWGGCWPGPNNTGVPSSVKLGTYRGSCEIRRTMTISAKSISCGLIILSGHVTIKNDMINGTVHTDGSGSVLIEDTTINGGSDHSESVGGANLTVIQDNIYGDQHEVHCYSNCTVENSWLHDNYNGASLGWHENGFFNDGGSHFTLIHNSVYCVGGCTADITFIPDGNVSYATVNKNLLVATRYAGYCLYPSSDPRYKPGVMTHMVITDNVFQHGSNGKCATYGPVYGWDRPTNNPDSDGYGNVWSGNVWNNGKPLGP